MADTVENVQCSNAKGMVTDLFHVCFFGYTLLILFCSVCWVRASESDYPVKKCED